MENCQRILSNIWKVVFVPISILLYLIVVLVIYIYKQIAVLLIKIQYRDAVLLSSTDTFLSYGETVESKQMLFSELVYGTIDIDLFRSLVMEKLVKIYARGHCYVEEKYGYYFWTEEKNFDITEHMIEVPEPPISTMKEWDKLQRELYFQEAISHGRSPWKALFISLKPGFEGTNGEPCFYMVIIVHHNMGDGFSGTKIISNALTEGEPMKPILSKQKKASVSNNWLELLLFPSQLPFYTMENFSGKRKIFDSHMLSGEMISIDTGKIKTQTVKDIRRALNVPFRVILLTAIMKALENFFQKTFQRIPEEITISIPQVQWTADDEVKPKNNFSLQYIRLPFNHKSCLDRLKEINEILNNSQTKEAFSYHHYVMTYMGNFIPSFIGKKFYKGSSHSAMFSIAGVEKKYDIILGGRKTVKTTYVRRMLNLVQNVGFLFSAITVGETVGFSIHSRSTITTEEGLQVIMNDILDEIEELKKHSLTDGFYNEF